MRRQQIDIVAEEIYALSQDSKTPFNSVQATCKQFYRRIARWHLEKLEYEMSKVKNAL